MVRLVRDSSSLTLMQGGHFGVLEVEGSQVSRYLAWQPILSSRR